MRRDSPLARAFLYAFPMITVTFLLDWVGSRGAIGDAAIQFQLLRLLGEFPFGTRCGYQLFIFGFVWVSEDDTHEVTRS